MSTVKLCDRCNKKIGTRRSVAIFKPVFINAVLNLRGFKDNYPGKWMYDEHNLDLCEDCTNKFFKFMDGAELVLDESCEGEDAV